MSIVVDIKSLGGRICGGLDVDNDLKLQTLGQETLGEWIYDIRHNDITGDGSYDIIRVIEIDGSVSGGTLVSRYFLVIPNGMTIALARQIDTVYDLPVEKRICSSYIYSVDTLLSRDYKSRVYPFKARTSYEDFRSVSSIVFTPVIPRAKGRHNVNLYMNVPGKWDDDSYLMWIDKVALQGWFPASVLWSMSVNAPPHLGWDIDGYHISEIQSLLENEVTLDIPVYGITRSSFLEYLMEQLTTSLLPDFKVVVDLFENPNDYHLNRVISTFISYNPRTGKEEVPENNNEYILIDSIIDNLIESLHDDGVNLTEIHSINLYRCLNDLVYIVINANEGPFAYLVMDYAKRLFIHYGYVDIPIAAIDP